LKTVKKCLKEPWLILQRQEIRKGNI
jgi:hypothetical protein